MSVVAAPRRMRRSELEAVLNCLYRAKAVYDEGFVDQGDESLRGIGFHEAAKQYVRRLAKAMAASDADEAAAAFVEGIAISQCPTHLVPEVHALYFDRFVPRFELDLNAYLVSEEVQFDEQFSWIPDLVYAYPDRLRIRDWKTFWKGYTDEQAAAEFQARFYLRQAMKVWPGFPLYEFEFVFVRLGTTALVQATPAELESVDAQVQAIQLKHALATRTGQWPATPGTHCRFCRLKCPVADDPRRIPLRLRTDDDAHHAFGRVLTLEQELKGLKVALGGWCEREGSVTVGGEELSYRARTMTRFPMSGVMETLRAHGADAAADAITVSKSALGPLLNAKRAPGPLVSDLGALAKETQSWQLRHQKAGADDPIHDDLDLAAEGGK